MENNLILEEVNKKIEPKLDLFILATTILLGLMAGLNFLDGDYFYTLVDAIIAAVFLYMYVMKQKLSFKLKASVVIAVCLIVAALSLFRASTLITGMMALFIIIVVAFSVFRLRAALILAGFCMVLVSIYTANLFFEFYSFNVDSQSNIFNPYTWLINTLILLQFIIICYYLIHGNREILLSSYESLEKSNQEVLDSYEILNNLAFFDQLTNLPSRTNISRYISSRLDDKHSKLHCLLLDINNFKQINSIYGEDRGDEVIKTIGIKLLKIINSYINAARLGSDEFLVCIENVSEDEVAEYMAFIIKSIRETVRSQHDIIVNFTAVYTSSESENLVDYQKIMNQLHSASKYAKDNKILDVLKFEAIMLSDVERDYDFKNSFALAIDNQELQLFYQAKVDVDNNKTIGVEALSRWFSPKYGLVSPAVFIPFVEKSRLTKEFGEWTIRQAIQDYDKIVKKYGDSVSVSVNVSPAYFFNQDFIAFIRNETKLNSFEPHNLTLEITEDIFIQDLNKVQAIINELHTLGVKVSLDDFGTGYASFSYLSKLSFDELKIDRSFVSDICCDQKVQALFMSIIALANTFKYQAVTEGVENEDEKNMVRSLGCNIVQGYLFSKPEAL